MLGKAVYDYCRNGCIRFWQNPCILYSGKALSQNSVFATQMLLNAALSFRFLLASKADRATQMLLIFGDLTL